MLVVVELIVVQFMSETQFQVAVESCFSAERKLWSSQYLVMFMDL